MSPFGSVFSKFDKIEIVTADEMRVSIKNNSLVKIGLKLLGLPHIGIRLRARKILKGLPKKMDTLLDAGCGTGVYSFTLHKRAKKIGGIDISEEKIEYVRSVNTFKNIKFFEGDLTELQIKNESFEYILFSDVLEHIKDYDSAFSEIARVLKKKGQLRLTVPYDSPSNRKDYQKYGHQKPGYSKKEIQELCKKNNLKIIQTEYYSYPLSEFFSKMNYSLINRPVLIAILFYPLYWATLFSEELRIGTPNGISFVIIK